jgi:predicted RNA-binding Zn-ribbon protein involved in translation (DUF1610 family)
MGSIKKIIKALFKPEINKLKGNIGEQKVSSKLNPIFFGKVKHKQINNLTLTDENGKTHQIDHVEIRQNGIFCIETKNYSGWIYGNETRDTWTQILYNEKYQFTNPIKQNKSHIYHLNKALNGNYKINSVIVFVQNNADKISIPYVVNLSNLKKYLANFSDGTNYSDDEMEQIYNILLDSSSIVSRKEHIENIKKTETEIANNICPRCGNQLIARKGRYGDFYGCSNYPNCKFIKNIKQTNKNN